MVRQLAAAMREKTTPDELKALLSPAGLLCLHAHYLEVQRLAWAPVHSLTEWLRKAVNDVPAVIVDGAAAWHTKSPADYYGLPSALLTPAQLTWYLGLREAYEEFHVERIDSRGKPRPPKQPTNQWLRKGYKERQRWQMTA